MTQDEDIYDQEYEDGYRHRAPEGSVAIGTPVKTYPGGAVWGIVCDSFIGGEDADGQGIIFYTVQWTTPHQTNQNITLFTRLD